MAFKLNKEESAQRDELVGKLEAAEGEMDAAISAANAALEALLMPVNEKIKAYNEVLAEAKEYVETVAGRWQEEFDAKTEKWQEGEKGTAASELITSWTDLDFEDVEEIEIEPIEEADFGHSEDLSNVAVEA